MPLDNDSSTNPHAASAATVAQRYAARARIAAGTEEDIRRHFRAFESARKDFVDALDLGQREGWDGDDIRVRRRANIPWVQLVQNGRPIVEGILSTRSIPRRSAKGMEMAYRLFSTAQRMPKDVFKWWAKNEKRVVLVLDAVKNWPPKQMGGEELFTLGSFTIHNTVGATGSELEALKKAIERVERLARTNPVPGFSRVVYGDIHVVARIRKAHHAAWYFASDDSLYVRRSKKTGIDEVHAILHELGHRYWHRFASGPTQVEWNNHHWRAQSKDVEVELPGVGDPLPIQYRGVEGYPVVDRMQGGIYHFEIIVEGKPRRMTYSVRKIYDFLAKQEKQVRNFPTRYASTSAEEHFCEAVALYAMGALDDEHAIPFKAIWS